MQPKSRRLVTEAALDARLAALPAGGGADALTPVTADTDTPAGTTVGELAGYLAQADVTVNGVALSSGQIAVFYWDGAAWQVASGGSVAAPAPTLSTPTVSASGITAGAVTLAYTGASGTPTAWQYRLNGGAWTALDGTSPDTITGLSPSTQYAVDVRYTLDGTTWSTPGSTAFKTADPAATYLRHATTNQATYPLTESGDATTGYTYQIRWTAYSGSPQFTTTTSTGTGDYTYAVALSGVAAALAGQTAQDTITLKVGTTSVAQAGYIATPKTGRPDGQTPAPGFYWGDGMYNLTNSTTFPVVPVADGDVIRVTRAGGNLAREVSKDGGQTWQQLASTATTDTASSKIGYMGGGNGWSSPITITKPRGTGAWA